MTPQGDLSRPSYARRAGDTILGAWFILAAACFALTTLWAIINFGFREPMWDQWREYEMLLGEPFPRNIVELNNGHRPIIPNLVRVAEIRWFDADQVLQLVLGALCAFASAFLLAACVWRERGLSRSRRAFGVLVAVLGLLWLGNARRLLHGSEALHGYVPTIFALWATLAAYCGRERHARSAPVLATALCVLATFSFGLGLAAFCSVLLLLLVERRPWQELALPAGTLLACLALYLLVLPGNDGVRNQLQFAPFESAVTFLRWMASPWKWAWFDPAADAEPVPNFATSLRPALLYAAHFATDNGLGVDAFCLVAGAAGVFLFALCTVRAWRRHEGPTRLEAVAIGAAVYAFASGALTVAARIQNLRDMPDQVYADRYLLWPTLFWCSIALLLIAQLPRLRRPAFRWPAALAAMLLPLVLLVSQNSNAIWGSLVYRVAENTAVAVRNGIYDPDHFTGELVGQDAHLREIALLRSRHLAMFADGVTQRVGTRWNGMLEEARGVATAAHWTASVHDPTASKPAGHLEGRVGAGLDGLHGYGQLLILAPDGVIAGLAGFSHASPFTPPLQMRRLPKRGFDGYVAGFDPRERYLLIAADFASNSALVLARIEPAQPAVAAAAP